MRLAPVTSPFDLNMRQQLYHCIMQEFDFVIGAEQGSPVSSKAEKTAFFSTVFSVRKKQFLPVSSAEIRKKLKSEL